MSLGSKNNEMADIDTWSPLGSVKMQGNELFLNPKTSKQLNRLEKLAISRQLKMINGLPKNMGFDQKLADRVFTQNYKPTLNALRGPLQQQHQQEQSSMIDTLSARNQLGSSFEAMQRDLMSRRQQEQMLQISNMAQSQVRDAANALAMNHTNAQVSNRLNTLQMLQALRDAYLQRQLAPLQMTPMQQQLFQARQQQQMQPRQRIPFGFSAGPSGLGFNTAV